MELDVLFCKDLMANEETSPSRTFTFFVNMLLSLHGMAVGIWKYLKDLDFCH